MSRQRSGREAWASERDTGAGWRVEVSGPVVRADDGVLMAETPLPVAVPLDDDRWALLTLRRARHASSGSRLEDRWLERETRYRRTYWPGADEPADGSRFAEAQRVLDGLPLPTVGRRKGTGRVTGDAILGAMLAILRRGSGEPLDFGTVADELGCDESWVRKLGADSWRMLQDVATAEADRTKSR